MIDKNKINDFTFTGLIIGRQSKQVFSSLETQLLIDVVYMQQVIEEDNDTKDYNNFILSVVYYFISKYSFFLVYMEQKEEYEYAAELKHHLIALFINLEVPKELIETIITRSINGYKEGMIK